jgi:hypothetical protein
MPRAGVHARRDAPLVQAALARLGLAMPPGYPELLRHRHRAIDRNTEDAAAHLHFMRGEDEESAPEALAEALGFLRRRAWRALGLLVEAVHAGGSPARMGALGVDLADVLHAVRDSYSKGHARRADHGTGPVVALVSWELERGAERGFGLRHALAHDIRFEWPWALWSPEVPASDRACSGALNLLVEAAVAPRDAREAVFAQRWQAFVASHFLPPDGEAPDEEEHAPEEELEAVGAT